jgi:hypothetical protein
MVHSLPNISDCQLPNGNFGFRIADFEFCFAPSAIDLGRSAFAIKFLRVEFEIRNPKSEIPYSYLNATNGSTFNARRAGM